MYTKTCSAVGVACYLPIGVSPTPPFPILPYPLNPHTSIVEPYPYLVRATAIVSAYNGGNDEFTSKYLSLELTLPKRLIGQTRVSPQHIVTIAVATLFPQHVLTPLLILIPSFALRSMRRNVCFTDRQLGGPAAIRPPTYVFPYVCWSPMILIVCFIFGIHA